jgi:type I restriction enzyme R subunit
MFPERARPGTGDVSLPRTVVYAVVDQHADEVVDAVRAVFGQGPGLCQKVGRHHLTPDEELVHARAMGAGTPRQPDTTRH